MLRFNHWTYESINGSIDAELEKYCDNKPEGAFWLAPGGKMA